MRPVPRVRNRIAAVFQSTLSAILIGIVAPLVLPAAAAPALRVVRSATAGIPLLQNGDLETQQNGRPAAWRPWGQGFKPVPGEGRAGSQAAACERREGEGEFGASQTLMLNRTNIAPLIIRGWSKAEQVTGSPDNGYSLYADLIYTDGTPLWGQTVSFRCGTHDWEQREFVLLPDKPIRSLTLHCLFRGHTGKVWFDDVSLEEVATPAGAVMFQGVPVKPPQPTTDKPQIEERTFATTDGLKLTFRDNTIVSLRVPGPAASPSPAAKSTLGDKEITRLRTGGKELATDSPSGFLARDYAVNSDVFAFSGDICPELNLRLKTQIKAQQDSILFEGRVSDTTGRDRAVTLLFALPLDAVGWQWGEDMRLSRVISGTGEFANTVTVHCGANGKMSRYPLAAVWNERVGLALALDMGKPAQYRLVYHAGTRQFLIAYDFALVRDTPMFPSGADFRFLLYEFDPGWGFRSALHKFYDIFPTHFTKRVKREGVWMPFTDIAKVPGFEDFGFAFQEGAPNVPFDDQHDIASFVYVEPMSYWLALPPEVPRTYAGAMTTLTNDLSGARGKEKQEMAVATLTSGIHTADGQFSLHLVKAPWCDGGMFTLNPEGSLSVTPELPTTKSGVMGRAIHAAYESNRAAEDIPDAGLDGVYLDSLEMSATQLNYRRDHFPFADVPLVFDRDGRPALFMMFSTWEPAYRLARDQHKRHKLMFANAVLWNFSFPAPLFDVLGTEVNWLHRGEYLPDSDAVMNFRRALCYQKPYCLLMNTDYEKFTPELVERYFQRCLFYGIWPGFFDQDAAAKDPYWTSQKKWYERDRPLFKKYIPLLQRVTAAGWQPITAAICDNPDVWIERYGMSSAETFFLTVFNDTAQPQEGVLALGREIPPLSRNVRVTELVSGENRPRAGKGWRIQLAPQSVAVLEFTRRSKHLDSE